MKELFFDNFSENYLDLNKWQIHEWSDVIPDVQDGQLQFVKDSGQIGLINAKVNENLTFINPQNDFKASFKAKIDSNDVLSLVGFGFENAPEPFFLGASEEIEAIPTGENSQNIVIDENRNRAYIRREYYRPTAINLATKESIGEIQTTSTCNALGFNKAADKIYSGGFYSNIIEIIDPDTLEQIQTIDLGFENYCYSIAANNETNKVYIASSNKLFTIDGESNEIEATLNLPSSFKNMAINEATNKLYAIYRDENIKKVAVVNLANNTFETEIEIKPKEEHDRLISIEINENTNKVYVTVSATYQPPWATFSNDLFVIDGQTNEIEDTIDLSSVAYRLRRVNYNSQTNKIYIASYGVPGMGGIRGKLIVLNGNTYEILTSLELRQAAYDIGINETTNMVYVLHTTYENVASIINGTTDTGNKFRYIHPNILYNGEWIVCEYEYKYDSRKYTKRFKFEGEENWRIEHEGRWEGMNPLQFIIAAVSFVGGQIPGNPTYINSKFDDIKVWGAEGDKKVIRFVTEDGTQTLKNKNFTDIKIQDGGPASGKVLACYDETGRGYWDTLQITNDHSQLRNLDYESSGHIGFENSDSVMHKIELHRQFGQHLLEQPFASHDNEKHTKNFITIEDVKDKTENILAKFEGINTTVEGATSLFIVPEGKKAVVTKIICRCTSATNITTPADISFGYNDPNYDNWLPQVGMHITEQDKFEIHSPIDPVLPIGLEGNTFKINVINAAQGISQIISVDVFGYLV